MAGEISSSRKRKKAEQSQQNQRCEQGNNDNHNRLDPRRNFPNPIITNILSRVEIKTLFNCRCVCKNWAVLISTPEFAKLHLSKSPIRCLIKPLIENRQTKTLHLIDPESPHNVTTGTLRFRPTINLPNFSLGLINSCNGLVCLCKSDLDEHVDGSDIFVCNPILREYVSIPNPPDVAKFEIDKCALGFSETTNQYKVVIGSYEKTDIYTLGEGKWRRVAKSPHILLNNTYNSFLNGALHWSEPGPTLLCFDFASEEFRDFPEPVEFGELETTCSDRNCVGVINGYLSVTDYDYYAHTVTIWVMKKYGVKESWSKDFVIDSLLLESKWDVYDPMIVSGNGVIFLRYNRQLILIYDYKAQYQQGFLPIKNITTRFHAIGHVSSFISLKNVAKGENLKVLSRKSIKTVLAR